MVCHHPGVVLLRMDLLEQLGSLESRLCKRTSIVLHSRLTRVSVVKVASSLKLSLF